jgi:hypothetical protein
MGSFPMLMALELTRKTCQSKMRMGSASWLASRPPHSYGVGRGLRFGDYACLFRLYSFHLSWRLLQAVKDIEGHRMSDALELGLKSPPDRHGFLTIMEDHL